MLPYSVEVVDDDAAVTAYAGLPLIVETMRKLGVSAQLDKQLGIRQRNNGTTDSQKAEGVVLRMASGGTCLSDIEKLRADKGLERCARATSERPRHTTRTAVGIRRRWSTSWKPTR